MRCCTHPESRQVAAYNPAGLVFSYIAGVFKWLPSGVIELTIDMMVRDGHRPRGLLSVAALTPLRLPML